MEKIIINAELLFELESKQAWINRVPQILPDKTRLGETWIWIDANGNVLECGADFSAAENGCSYPVKCYRPCSVSEELNKAKNHGTAN
jgi:hypothetical protein